MSKDYYPSKKDQDIINEMSVAISTENDFNALVQDFMNQGYTQDESEVMAGKVLSC